MKSIIVNLDEETHHKLKVKVAKDKTTLKAVVERFIKEYLGEGVEDE